MVNTHFNNKETDFHGGKIATGGGLRVLIPFTYPSAGCILVTEITFSFQINKISLTKCPSSTNIFKLHFGKYIF